MPPLQTAAGSGSLPRLHDPDHLIFVRHGQTDWNRDGRMQGHRDIPLNKTGMKQAAANGARLRTCLEREGLDPKAFDFVASPLGRAKATMELVREHLGFSDHDYRLEDRLLELTFGQWEGSRLEDLAETQKDLILQRRADKWRFTPPGGESYEMLAVRVGEWLKTVTTPTIAVAHGGVFRVLRGLLEGLESTQVTKFNVAQDKVFVWRGSRFREI